MKANKIILLIGAVSVLLMTSCQDDFLNEQPISNLTPENYLNQESDLASYTTNLFTEFDVFPTEGNPFAADRGTDVMTNRGVENKYVPGQWKVPQKEGDWNFKLIYQCNYFLQTVLPKYYEGKISGDIESVKHDIGEMYMIRALLYFKKLQNLGDFPIITTTLPDELTALTAASQRSPQTEVARFILADLDSAIAKLKTVAPDGNRNRLSKMSAQLFKSRVALYEATWLKYFKGTAFVPNGPGWPGANKDYNKNYTFKSGSIDGEIAFFFSEAMISSKVVADATPLVANNMVIQQKLSDPVNPYCAMFGDVDLSPYSEVLFWRRYDLALKVTNNIAVEMGKGNGGCGYTRGMVDGFLMSNGLPIYAPGSGYAGDDMISQVRRDRDGRLFLFLKEPKQINILKDSPAGTHATPIEPYPDILNKTGNGDYPTGYSNRKGLSYDAALCGNGLGYTGEIIFRGVEAYLNYMEACYEMNGNLDADALKYWKAIRTRAAVDDDIQKTIDATDLSKEAANDWGVYSAGTMVDATLYNIRRERRCELMAEGLRNMDLRRWRAMDQMITTPYHIEGFKLWGPMQEWYNATDLKYNAGNSSTVSDPALSDHLRIFQRLETSLLYDGCRWTMAHYWNPIANEHFLITSEDFTDPEKSPIYQNPGWPTTANSGPIGF
ncbi:MAG TPA: RagB/SusD family nutrient uptake outer membrane protein [Prolixibacteraceae bacterium]|nr:RagB/SusD family nutrient uptake outer membrane protein [Prolixibacteraceae bacterium]